MSKDKSDSKDSSIRGKIITPIAISFPHPSPPHVHPLLMFILSPFLYSSLPSPSHPHPHPIIYFSVLYFFPIIKCFNTFYDHFILISSLWPSPSHVHPLFMFIPFSSSHIHLLSYPSHTHSHLISISIPIPLYFLILYFSC